MSRLLDDFLYRTSLLTIVRGKCRYDRHESVRLVDGQWWGESSRSFECAWAPEHTCPKCDGKGFLVVSAFEAQMAQYDGDEHYNGPAGTQKVCPGCAGTCYLPGPHWPYRFPEPPPLRVRD